MSGGWYHCSVKPVKRSAGRSAVAAAAYRMGERLEDQRLAVVHDYRARGGVNAKFTVAPGDAPDWVHDTERLWNEVEKAEKRKDSLLAREVELALPASVSPEMRREICEAFASHLVERYGVAVSVAVHAPSEDGNENNHHAHILFSTRQIGPEGFGAKTLVLDDRKTGPQEVKHLREHACELINQALADSGSDERIDHRSFKERGIDFEPTVHVGPYGMEIERTHQREVTEGQGRQRRARDPEKRAERSRLAKENEAIRARNAALKGQVAELAAIDASMSAAMEYGFDHSSAAVQAHAISAALEAMQAQMIARSHAEHAALQRLEKEQAAAVASAETAEAQAWPDLAVQHRATRAEAARERIDILYELRGAWNAAAQRVQRWWENARGHFTEWREALQERIDGYVHSTPPEYELPEPSR